MSDRPDTRSDKDKEMLDLYKKVDPDTLKEFAAALKEGKFSLADIMSMASDVMNDPNVSALFQSMKKVFGSGRNKNSETTQQLLAFTFFYSSSIYAMLLCFFYWKWNNSEKAGQPEDADAPADTE